MGAQGHSSDRRGQAMRNRPWAAAVSIAGLLGTATSVAAQPHDVPYVRIGSLDWMSRNVDVTSFRNGDPVAEITGAEAWAEAGRSSEPATTLYENNARNLVRWGRLYNFAAVNDARGLCPEGWRVPEDPDWTELEQALGVDVAAARLRSDAGWIAVTRSPEDVGFNALPAGFRTQRGDDFLAGRVAYFWSATSVSERETTAHMLFDYDSRIFRIVYDKAMGMSLRCVRNAAL